jgi:hypothetical protein
MLLRYREYSFELRTPVRKEEKKKQVEGGTAPLSNKEILEPNAQGHHSILFCVK